MQAITEFFTIDVIFYSAVAGTILIVLLLLWIIRLEVRIRNLLKGKRGASLEDSITLVIRDQEDIAAFRKELEQYLDTVEARLRRSTQGIGTVRFNAFKGTGDGGNQSFATAFVNQKGDGVMISSIFARDRVNVFAKPLKGYASPLDLTEEEREALQEAKKEAGAQ